MATSKIFAPLLLIQSKGDSMLIDPYDLDNSSGSVMSRWPRLRCHWRDDDIVVQAQEFEPY